MYLWIYDIRHFCMGIVYGCELPHCIQISWVITWMFYQEIISNLILSLYKILKSIGSDCPVALFLPICLMIWSILILLSNCEMGQNVSNQFQVLSEEICKCDWYLMPHNLQRILIIIILNVQPVLISGFANVVCSRDSFKRVNLHITTTKSYS